MESVEAPGSAQEVNLTYKIAWVYCDQSDASGHLPPKGYDNEIIITGPIDSIMPSSDAGIEAFEEARGEQEGRTVYESSGEASNPNADDGSKIFCRASVEYGTHWANMTCLYDFVTDTLSDFELNPPEDDGVDDEDGEIYPPYAMDVDMYESMTSHASHGTDNRGLRIDHFELKVPEGSLDGPDIIEDQKVVRDDKGDKMLFVRLNGNNCCFETYIYYCKRVREGHENVLTEGEKGRLGWLPVDDNM